MVIENIVEIVISLEFDVLASQRQISQLFIAKEQQIKDEFEKRKLAPLEVRKVGDRIYGKFVGHSFKKQFINSYDVIQIEFYKLFVCFKEKGIVSCKIFQKV